MKLKPGCGCLILVLALCNLVFVVADIVTMFRGPAEKPVNPSNLMLGITGLIFAANVAVCVMMGLAALRGVSFGRKSAAQDTDESTVEDSTFAAEDATDEGQD